MIFNMQLRGLLVSTFSWMLIFQKPHPRSPKGDCKHYLIVTIKCYYSSLKYLKSILAIVVWQITVDLRAKPCGISTQENWPFSKWEHLIVERTIFKLTLSVSKHPWNIFIYQMTAILLLHTGWVSKIGSYYCSKGGPILLTHPVLK